MSMICLIFVSAVADSGEPTTKPETILFLKGTRMRRPIPISGREFFRNTVSERPRDRNRNGHIY